MCSVRPPEPRSRASVPRSGPYTKNVKRNLLQNLWKTQKLYSTIGRGRMFGNHKRLGVLEAEVEQIKRELRELTVDLPELQRKMVRVLRNTARERARMEELDTPDKSGEPTPPDAAAAVPGGPFLTPRQRQVQQSILRRRAGG